VPAVTSMGGIKDRVVRIEKRNEGTSMGGIEDRLVRIEKRNEGKYLDLVHQLHGLNDADRLPLGDLVSNLDEGWLAWSGGVVEGSRHGGCHLPAAEVQHQNLSSSICGGTDFPGRVG